MIIEVVKYSKYIQINFRAWHGIFMKFIQTGIGETGLTQKYAFIKKSTFFMQSLQNFDKIRYSRVLFFVKVS